MVLRLCISKACSNKARKAQAPVRKLMEAVTKFCFRILGKSWDAKDTRMKVVKKDKTTADSRKTRPRMMYTDKGRGFQHLIWKQFSNRPLKNTSWDLGQWG